MARSVVGLVMCNMGRPAQSPPIACLCTGQGGRADAVCVWLCTAGPLRSRADPRRSLNALKRSHRGRALVYCTHDGWNGWFEIPACLSVLCYCRVVDVVRNAEPNSSPFLRAREVSKTRKPARRYPEVKHRVIFPHDTIALDVPRRNV